MQSTFPVLDPASPHAQAVYELFLQVLAVSAVIFGSIAGLIIVAVWRGRRRAALPEQDFGSHRTEIRWMIGPFLVVSWLAAASATLVLVIQAAPKAHPPREESADADFVVIGHQWWWEVRNLDEGIRGANELHIPVGKKVRISLESADVIHSFWIPQLAGKMDCIPGRANHIWLEANSPGTYEGFCAEFCGSQHAWMKLKVYAYPPKEYAKWLKEAKQTPRKAVEAQELAGERLFFTATCANCHAIQGTAATAKIGPELTHLARRKLIGAGVAENTHDNLVQWLKDPQSLKPGCKMPNFRFSDEQVKQLAAYLEAMP